MSLVSTAATSLKQRRLSDLRVVDLQRELRTFGITYDKKELKGVLVDKLRQALISRNCDPDLYLFETTADLKSVASDDNNRHHEESGSQETNASEAVNNVEINSAQRFNIEHSVQSMSNPSANHSATTSTAPSTDDLDEQSNDQTNRMDTIDLRQIVNDREDEFFTIDTARTKTEDENNNDKIDPGLMPPFHSPSDEDSNTTNHLFDPNPSSLAATAAARTQQTASDRTLGEDDQSTTTELSTDNENVSKRQDRQQQQSTDEQQQGSNSNQPNKSNTIFAHNQGIRLRLLLAQCHLWVSNIAKETHASDLKELFSKHGKVLTTKVIGSSSSLWFGYINLASPDDVEKCIQALHQTQLHGKKIHVDREMCEETLHSSSSKSRTSDGLSSREPSNANKTRSDHSSYKSSSGDSNKRRDSLLDQKEKSSSDASALSKKRSASSSGENKKKLSTSDVYKSDRDDQSARSLESASSAKRTSEMKDQQRKPSSTSSNNQSLKYPTSRTDFSKSTDKSESSRLSQKSSMDSRRTDKHSNRSDHNSSTHATDGSKLKTSSPSSHRSRSSEKRSSSSTTSDYRRGSSIDKSKRHDSSSSSSHTLPSKYEKSKDSSSKDSHRSTATSSTFESDRRSTYENEQRLRHEKELLARKHYVQQEEENIKEQQRRLADERDRMKREFEMLERERSEIERTRFALEKEKQDQARELEKQQRRLADEAKHRQQQADAQLREEKLHRLPVNDNKRSRSSHQEPARSHHSNASHSNGSPTHFNKGYNQRTSANATSGHGRDRSLDDSTRDYYPESKRQYTNTANHQRDEMFRDRPAYRNDDLPPSSSVMSSSNSAQRYLPAASSQARLSDPYSNLPPRGRDMALPPTSSVGVPYERSSRNVAPPPTNPGPLLRRPQSRERFDDRGYIQPAERRERSPPISNALRREPMETSHWERPKPRDPAHYESDTQKYLTNQYTSQPSAQSAQQQQGLWSSAPPSRQQQHHHHPDLSVKPDSHGPLPDRYTWQHVGQQVAPPPSSSHHSQGLPPSHDRSRGGVTNNQRLPILPSNQAPPPPPSLAPSSSRGNTAGQSHLYSHSGLPVSALGASQQQQQQQQQRVTMAPPPPSLHHTTAYITQTASPAGLVLHSTGQPRAYEPHYVVAQSLPQRRY